MADNKNEYVELIKEYVNQDIESLKENLYEGGNEYIEEHFEDMEYAYEVVINDKTFIAPKHHDRLVKIVSRISETCIPFYDDVLDNVEDLDELIKGLQDDYYVIKVSDEEIEVYDAINLSVLIIKKPWFVALEKQYGELEPKMKDDLEKGILQNIFKRFGETDFVNENDLEKTIIEDDKFLNKLFNRIMSDFDDWFEENFEYAVDNIIEIIGGR